MYYEKKSNIPLLFSEHPGVGRVDTRQVDLQRLAQRVRSGKISMVGLLVLVWRRTAGRWKPSDGLESGSDALESRRR